MQIINLEQRSVEWHEFRKGKITGTRLGSIWAARQYTVADVEKLLTGRGIDLAEFQAKYTEKRKAAGLKGKKYTKADLEELLTEEDKATLSSEAEKKIEYYQILADQVAINPEDEDDGKWMSNNGYFRAMDRGAGEEAASMTLFEETYADTLLKNKKLLYVGCCASDVDPRIINSPDALIVPKNWKEGNKVKEAAELKMLASAKHLMAFFEQAVPEDYWTQKVQYFTVNPDLERLYWIFVDPRVPMLPIFVLIIERQDLGHWPETMLKYQLRTMKELDELKIRLIDESSNIVMKAKADKGVVNV